MKNTLFATTYTFVVGLSVVIILVIGYQSSFHLWNISGWALGTIYGMYLLFHLFLQMTMAYHNKGLINHYRRHAKELNFNPTISILSAGYNENTDLLRQHYLSIKKLRDPFVRYWFMSDGPTSDPNNTMAAVFKQVFPDGVIIEFPYVLKYADEKQQQQWQRKINNIAKKTKYIFIAQPHVDKRRAMYTGLKAILLKDQTEIIINTDSDTRFDRNVIREMAAPFINPRTGAVTGDVRILNHSKKTGGTWLSFLSSLRYWQAFNLERAAQSLFGVVYCVSGPLGAYRREVWEEIIEDWSSQTFFGRLTTTGDDRCATNMTLRSKGKQFGETWRVHFTPFTYCETETPTQLWRWIKQQERWSRSFYREAPLTYIFAHKHHTWLNYEMFYHVLFPFFLVVSIINQIATVLRTHNIEGFLIFITIIYVCGLIRSLYGTFYTKRKTHLFLSLYGFLYMGFLIWAKLFALLFVWRTGWGTSSRHNLAYAVAKRKSIP